jgi:hypothetical protein
VIREAFRGCGGVVGRERDSVVGLGKCKGESIYKNNI